MSYETDAELAARDQWRADMLRSDWAQPRPAANRTAIVIAVIIATAAIVSAGLVTTAIVINGYGY